ncbi:SDR family NAD(P)-dependent oxidoreductase [Micromonospora musae]|uniref:SDR family NAD(P)-dependent oxidoreductase n=1 Tax=Micromonospora musae TaxID=1894970 RepID=UPI003422441D
MGDLTGKVALVTGASRGIGAATAKRLARDGARVAVHYCGNEQGAQQTVAAIKEAGGTAFTLQADFAQPGATESLWNAYDRKADGVDIIVNNAGIALPKPITETSEEEVRLLFQVNAEAPYFLIRHGLSRLRDHGRIINLSSVAASVALPFELAYSMTKATMDIFTKTLAWDRAIAGRHITVNAVRPSLVDTDMAAYLVHVPQRFEWATSQAAVQAAAQPEEMAAVVAFLASEDARFITGHILDATGGTGLGPTGL